VAAPASWWRRARRHFGISAPRMAVRTHLSWPCRAVLGLGLVAVVGGMWWWGFDFGQIFGGFNRTQVESQLSTLQVDVARLRTETTELRAKNAWLASELAMKEGSQSTLTKQITELQGENSQLKEDLVFLQKLVSDSNKQVDSRSSASPSSASTTTPTGTACSWRAAATRKGTSKARWCCRSR
jgi:hypothetical protein